MNDKTYVKVKIISKTTNKIKGVFSAGGYLEIKPPGPHKISSLVSGKIKSLAVKPGDSVKKGDVLAMLDESIFKQEEIVAKTVVELARSHLDKKKAGYLNQEIKSAKAKYNNAEIKMEYALKVFLRFKELFRKKAVTRNIFDEKSALLKQTESELDEAKAELTLLEDGTRQEEINISVAELESAIAKLKVIQWKIKECNIVSDSGGIILEQFANIGDWLDPEGDSHESASLYSIFDSKSIQAWVDVNQRDSQNVFIEQNVELTTDAKPEDKIKAMVSQIMPMANRQKNTIQIKINIPEIPEEFRPELSVRIKFLPPQKTVQKEDDEISGFKIPGSSIIRRDNKTGVFVVKNGKSIWKQISTGKLENGVVTVTSGLSEGEKIIIDNVKLFDGQEIIERKDGIK